MSGKKGRGEFGPSDSESVHSRYVESSEFEITKDNSITDGSQQDGPGKQSSSVSNAGIHTSLPHSPVLLNEAVDGLNIDKDGLYVDATYGRGGHARAILKRLSSQGCLIAMDRDKEALAHAQNLLGEDPRCRIVHCALQEFDQGLAEANAGRKANGVLADLGVSSPQLDDARRGFSFLADGPLDMRMDTENDVDASTWLNHVEEVELAGVLRDFGEERYARRIARAIVNERKTRPIVRTAQLAEIVTNAVPTREKNKHPATRTFQAVRIKINAELDQLGAFLPKAVRALSKGGRLVVISFHSLEDRLVKRFMREQSRGDDFPARLPVTADQLKPSLRLVSRACRPSPDEIARNPRARSAVLRIAQRTEHCYA